MSSTVNCASKAEPTGLYSIDTPKLSSLLAPVRLFVVVFQ